MPNKVNREKSVTEVIQETLVPKGVFRQSSEALKYKFNLLKKIPKSWHLEYLLIGTTLNTVAEVTMGKVEVVGHVEGQSVCKMKSQRIS